jgi:hypothetical protein
MKRDTNLVLRKWRCPLVLKEVKIERTNEQKFLTDYKQ